MKPIFCTKHQCSRTIPVCTHLYDSVLNDKFLPIVPIFYERFILDFYFEKYWVCRACSSNYDINVNGIVFYDPDVRRILSLDDFEEDSIDETLDYKLDDPLEEFKKEVKAVCRDCFSVLYGNECDRFLADLSSFETKALTKQ